MKKAISTVSNLSVFFCFCLCCVVVDVDAPCVLVLVAAPWLTKFLLQVIMSLYPGITGKYLFVYAGLDFLIQDGYVFV